MCQFSCAQKIYMEGPAFCLVMVTCLVMMPTLVMIFAVAVLMHVSGMLSVNVCARFVAAVVVAELAGGQGTDEDGQSYEHRDSLPAEVTALMFFSIRLFFSFVDLVAILTFGCGRLDEYVHDYADCYGNYEQDGKQDQSLVRDHCKHNEGLVS